MMTENTFFTPSEVREVKRLTAELLHILAPQISIADINAVHRIVKEGILNNHYRRDVYGINPTLRNLRTAVAFSQLIAPDRDITIAIMLYRLCDKDFLLADDVRRLFGEETAKIIEGLKEVAKLYRIQAVADDNRLKNEKEKKIEKLNEKSSFQKLLITYAHDIRVVIIMIVDRLALMRTFDNSTPDTLVKKITEETSYLYAPLAHRLGLYAIKTEFEDTMLKLQRPDDYGGIVNQLKRTKEMREDYISKFISPIAEALKKDGINCEIKGRTKSISSIWKKMIKQKVDFDGVYDLFAIRIIIDSGGNADAAKEKKDCWVVYSIVTDIYKDVNVARMRDWISVPKSTGYQSLHITVRGPGGRWVEVQIRTCTMDFMAERGLAAHWKYKGEKSGGNLDVWASKVRDILEAGSHGQKELIRDKDVNLSEEEVFVYTRDGDLVRLSKGATVLDFAFNIHSRIGCQCIGAIVNGKNQKINYRLRSGDTVKILTSSNQTPRQDWLNFVATSKARTKIRQAVNERRTKRAEAAKELLLRRFKNRKVDIDDSLLSKFVVKFGYKNMTDFYIAIDEGKHDIATVIEQYVDFTARQAETTPLTHETAENFVLKGGEAVEEQQGEILVIDNNVKGLNYRLSKCCNPIFGDDIVGFVASDGAVKIHRRNCGNVRHLLQKYPYRIIKTRWSGRVGAQFAASLRVVGRDDIGVVSNITSLINKEPETLLRSITINSNRGLFEGYLVVSVGSLASLDGLMKKIKNLKGVKDVQRAQ